VLERRKEGKKERKKELLTNHMQAAINSLALYMPLQPLNNGDSL